MAYIIVKSNGQVLTTIADGTINTTSSSLGLPGRNYAGYGQTLDTNFVHILENFASNTAPANPLTGQLWFNTNSNILYVCPQDDAPASEWLALATTSSNGVTTFGQVTVTGNVACGNITATNTISGAGGVFGNLSISISANIVDANITTANIGTLTTAIITTGANTTPGSLTGTWTLTTGSTLQATYADLAERFEADAVLEPGTVVQLGGIKEITSVKYELSEDVFGVISNSAAYLMNSNAGDNDTHPPVAVSGRVKVKCTGKILKGQRLVSAGNGIARAAKEGEANAFNTIGRALTDKLTDGTDFVEAIVMIR